MAYSLLNFSQSPLLQEYGQKYGLDPNNTNVYDLISSIQKNLGIQDYNDAYSLALILDPTRGGREDVLRSRPGVFGDWTNIDKNFGGYEGFAKYLIGGGKLDSSGYAIPTSPVDLSSRGTYLGTNDQGQAIFSNDKTASGVSGPTTGTLASPGGSQSATGASQQVYRDFNNNFYTVDASGNKTPLTLDQFHQLGINETFVKAGQTVPLYQAQTGQSLPAGTDQNAMDALHFLGFTDQQIRSMSPGDLQQWSLTAEYLKKQSDLGNITAQNNALSLQKAYQAALNDPNIINKYGDIRKNDVANFTANLQALQEGTDLASAQQKIKFNEDRRNLADQFASAGAAYSGFRNKAKQDLDTEQSGIISSSLATLKNNLRSMLNPLETYYGSGQFASLFPSAGISYQNPLTGESQNLAYSTVGGLAGTETASKDTDIANRQQQIYQNLATPV